MRSWFVVDSVRVRRGAGLLAEAGNREGYYRISYYSIVSGLPGSVKFLLGEDLRSVKFPPLNLLR